MSRKSLAGRSEKPIFRDDKFPCVFTQPDLVADLRIFSFTDFKEGREMVWDRNELYSLVENIRRNWARIRN